MKNIRNIGLYFQEYTDLTQRIKELYWEIDEIETQLYTVKCQSYDNSIRGGSGNDSKDYLIDRKDRLMQKLHKLKNRVEKIGDNINNDIEKLSDARYKSIIRNCYMNRYSNERVSNILGVSISHFYRLKNQAVDEFLKLVVNDSN